MDTNVSQGRVEDYTRFSMSRDEILDKLRKAEPRLRELGVRTLVLFGSTARGEDRPDSDVDLAVEFRETASFDGFFAVKDLVEELLHRNVDLVTLQSLRPRLRAVVEKGFVSRDPELYLDDIREAVARVGRYTTGMERTAFEADEKTFDAVIRNLEIHR